MSSPTTDLKASDASNIPTEAPKKNLVTIKAVYPIRLTEKDGSEKIVSVGQTADVTEEQAKEFCDTKFDLGYTDTFGERDERDIKKTIVSRAVRVK